MPARAPRCAFGGHIGGALERDGRNFLTCSLASASVVKQIKDVMNLRGKGRRKEDGS